MNCVYASGANLSVGSRAIQLIFSLLVVVLPLAPSLVALVRVVPRDAHGLVLAGKKELGYFLHELIIYSKTG